MVVHGLKTDFNPSQYRGSDKKSTQKDPMDLSRTGNRGLERVTTEAPLAPPPVA